MKVGDLIKHKWGTLWGRGVIVSLEYGEDETEVAIILWMTGQVVKINSEWLEAV